MTEPTEHPQSEQPAAATPPPAPPPGQHPAPPPGDPAAAPSPMDQPTAQVPPMPPAPPKKTAAVGRFFRHRVTQLVGALVIGLLVGGGAMAVIQHGNGHAGDSRAAAHQHFRGHD